MILLLPLLCCAGGRPGATGGQGEETGGGAPVGDTGADDVDDGCVAVGGSIRLDAWGGDLRVDLGEQDGFTLTNLCDRFWLVTPGGHPTVHVAVNSTAPSGSTDRVTGENRYADTVADLYESDEAWAEATAERLAAWGFTGAGAWSDTDHLRAWTTVSINLDLAQDDWESGAVADYFDPAWQTEVEARAAAGVRPGDPNVVGYFLDNEVHWGPDWRTLDTLLQSYLGLPADAPGKQVAVGWMLGRLGSVDALNAALGTHFTTREELLTTTDAWQTLGFDADGEARALVDGFLELVARQYFAVTVAAVRRADPGHLVLGNREVSVMTPEAVWRAQADLVDVVSVNRYTYIEGLEEAALSLSGGVDPGDDLQTIHLLTDRPVLVSEFGFRAADSAPAQFLAAGLPDLRHPGCARPGVRRAGHDLAGRPLDRRVALVPLGR